MSATPDSGFYVEGWTINDITQGMADTKTIWMNGNHVVQLNFGTTPPPPPTAFPTSIRELKYPLNLKQSYKGYWEPNDTTRTQTYRVDPVSAYTDLFPYWVSETAIFQVWDDILLAPVPDVRCRLYSDGADLLSGFLGFGGGRGGMINHYGSSNPIYGISNANGEIHLNFYYVLADVNPLVEKHIAYVRHFSTKSVGYCLRDGDAFPYCNVLLNGCWSETTVTTQIPCSSCRPACIDTGEQEYYRIHTITCLVDDNPSVGVTSGVNCYAGIKHT